MNIFVCIKQVPAVSKVEVDKKTGVLKRAGVKSKMNPYDLFALETALRLKEQTGGKVTVGTMGPLQAKNVVQEAYMMGADKGYVFSDRRLGGADVLATSYALSQAIRIIGDFDLILCGKQTTDGDTAQVGPSIAEHMGIPHAAWVSKVMPREKGILVEQQLQDVIETVLLPFPCLITVEQNIYTPRLPSMKMRIETRDKDITVFGMDDFIDRDPENYG
ncbi:MAG: electron transfer flavoprotein subunit beta/FixA family protein, partial [Ruminococcaceae bacterium]|nr:electron transfer flavoprotein subunit beta/FixA family protein [Oscillospiraceae bacterium]